MMRILYAILGLAIGCLAVYSINAFATDTISSTVSSTVSSSSNTVSSGTTTVKGASTAQSPSVNVTNSDICKSAGFSGAIQTQVFGISTGGTIVTDENCMRIKNSRVLNQLGLKTVAAGIMAQEPGVFLAMWNSGVYPPIAGKLGQEARALWIANPDKLPAGVTLESLLLKEELDALNPVETSTLPDRKMMDGHEVCKSPHGNYYMSC